MSGGSRRDRRGPWGPVVLFGVGWLLCAPVWPQAAGGATAVDGGAGTAGGATTVDGATAVDGAKVADGTKGAAGAKSGEPREGQVPIEVFQEPRAKHFVQPAYPIDKALSLGEGWVHLGFMVSPAGKPYEITVVDSTGDKTFEQLAIAAVEQSTFEPGTLNGKPMESASEVVYTFMIPGGARGATPAFVKAYESLLNAIRARDKAAADAAMKRIQITNLYEDARFGFAQYEYAQVWGTESQQIEGLRRAIGDAQGDNLSADQVEKLRAARLGLEIKTHAFAEALADAKALLKTPLDGTLKTQITKAVSQIEALRAGDREYGVAGELANGSWNLKLFKRNFRIAVSEGSVSEVKLRCQKRYLSFVFDPKLQYRTSGDYGSCWMELQGAPGTKFTLYQF